MEVRNSKSKGSSASGDSSNGYLAMGRQPQVSPLSSANAFLTPAFNACIHPQNVFDLDPALLRYSRSAADGFLSPTLDAGKFTSRRRRHLRSLSSSRGSSPSPLSAIENIQTPPSRSPPVFKATTPPSKVVEGEEVLVMDGILVNSPSPTGTTRSSSTRTDSSGSSGSSGLYKTEICRSWEDSGICRYGTKCQFAHGKEELRPARHPRSKTELIDASDIILFSDSLVGQTLKSSVTAGPCKLAAKNSQVHHAPQQGLAASPAVAVAAAATATGFTTEAEEMVCEALQVGPEAAESYIQQILYGHSQKRRLPVFVDICAEGEANSQQRPQSESLPDSFPIIM
ncbi:hypothetical protein ACLOJK_010406 [Asimina triloba]